MPTYAHIETGRALDPINCASVEAYLKLFHPSVTGDWNVQEVPSTTAEGNRIRHNAISNGDGTWTNQQDIPPPPPVIHEPVEEQP